MSIVVQDVRRVARGLSKTPGFTLVVLLTIGLGIGATTSIYSVVHGVLLAPLPYPDQERIVSISEEVLDAGGQNLSVSYVNGQDWKSAQTTLDAIALVRGGAVTLNGPDGAQQISALFADPEYFEIFGAEVARGGRPRLPAEHRDEGARRLEAHLQRGARHRRSPSQDLERPQQPRLLSPDTEGHGLGQAPDRGWGARGVVFGAYMAASREGTLRVGDRLRETRREGSDAGEAGGVSGHGLGGPLLGEVPPNHHDALVQRACHRSA